ncbi:MAG: type I-U CRISPR-associated RAMP protein Csb1/Cas7u [Gemmataceae bacterium]|nr:type I-U CRISPR-associated RAMP protein Csb1/Cas7u [Gemmata sp.]MDW8196881.1 type I-U CRISPR-associated RAMP protein Csb1/Cas7u [Gemmataceae bacterium]
MADLAQFDHYLSPDGPTALVIREYLMPVEGRDGVVFPATFAAGDGFPGGYNIDTDAHGNSVALIDSVGSQANRIEPIFKEPQYRHLVPQIVIKAGDKTIHLLDAGHRAGDAIVRCSSLQEKLQEAFHDVLTGNAEPLAKIAPTSLVFGVWDSRNTQAKLPRLVASTIRAFNVQPLHRSAQYVPAIDYVQEKLLDEPPDTKTKDAYAVRGFIHVPATWTHGGVIATGGIRRDATLSLAALRLLRAKASEEKSPDKKEKQKEKKESVNEEKLANEKTQALQRYILGLALVAFTYRPSGYLRQGCLLVLDPEKPREFAEVYPDGSRRECTITHEQALQYATEAAQKFGVGNNAEISFEKEKAQADVTESGSDKGKTKKASKNKA